MNTGFGPMAQYRIEDKDQLALQYNIIRSHSSGMGAYFSPEIVKSAILCRLHTLSLGKSGVHPSLIHLMKELINTGTSPLNLPAWERRCQWRLGTVSPFGLSADR